MVAAIACWEVARLLLAATQFVERHRGALTVALLALALAGAGAWIQRSLDRRPLVVQPGAATAPAVGSIRVHVAGAVANPGVYTLNAGDRVAEAIAAAGGTAQGADADSLNLAARLKDESRVVVPTARPTASAAKTPALPTASGQVGPINLNSAGQGELEKLPGIGPVTAAKIVEHRSKYGPFKSIDDLSKAQLVSASTLERIRPLVVVR